LRSSWPCSGAGCRVNPHRRRRQLYRNNAERPHALWRRRDRGSTGTAKRTVQRISIEFTILPFRDSAARIIGMAAILRDMRKSGLHWTSPVEGDGFETSVLRWSILLSPTLGDIPDRDELTRRKTADRNAPATIWRGASSSGRGSVWPRYRQADLLGDLVTIRVDGMRMPNALAPFARNRRFEPAPSSEESANHRFVSGGNLGLLAATSAFRFGDIRSPFSARLAPQSLVLKVIGLGRAGPHCMAAYICVRSAVRRARYCHCPRRALTLCSAGLGATSGIKP